MGPGAARRAAPWRRAKVSRRAAPPRTARARAPRPPPPPPGPRVAPAEIRTLQLSILRSRSDTSTPPLASVSAAQAPLGPPPITATRSLRLPSASPSFTAWTRTDRARPILRPPTARRDAEARRGWAVACILCLCGWFDSPRTGSVEWRMASRGAPNSNGGRHLAFVAKRSWTGVAGWSPPRTARPPQRELKPWGASRDAIRIVASRQAPAPQRTPPGPAPGAARAPRAARPSPPPKGGRPPGARHAPPWTPPSAAAPAHPPSMVAGLGRAGAARCDAARARAVPYPGAPLRAARAAFAPRPRRRRAAALPEERAGSSSGGGGGGGSGSGGAAPQAAVEAEAQRQQQQAPSPPGAPPVGGLAGEAALLGSWWSEVGGVAWGCGRPAGALGGLPGSCPPCCRAVPPTRH
jgi:hypothetical protein